MAKDRAAHAMGGGKKPSKKSSKKKSKKPVHKMHIRRSANGFIAEHHQMPDEAGGASQMEEHSLPNDVDQLADHVRDHFGSQQEGGGEEAAAPPQGDPAPAMA